MERLADRRGHTYVLFWTALAAVLLDALAWSGLNPALSNLALGLGGILGSLLAGGLSGSIPYHLPLLASAIGRISAVFWLLSKEHP